MDPDTAGVEWKHRRFVEGEGTTVKRMVEEPQREEEEEVSEEAGTTTDVARRDVATPQPRRQVRVSGSIMELII